MSNKKKHEMILWNEYNSSVKKTYYHLLKIWAKKFKKRLIVEKLALAKGNRF